MDMSELQLRTSAVGGFNKQDVVAYIESMAQRHKEELAARDQNLAALQAQLDTEKADHAALRERNDLAERQNTELTCRLAECENLRAELSAQAESGGARAQELSAQVEALTAQVHDLKPKAEAYLSIKDRAAGIELEAHQRAQLLQDQSDEEFRRAHEELCRWSDQVAAEYRGTRSQMDIALAQAAGELDKMKAAMAALEDKLAGQDSALERLLGRYRENNSTKLAPPAPMPLNEEE